MKPPTPQQPHASRTPLQWPALPAKWLTVLFAAALATRAAWGVYRFLVSADPTTLEFPDEQQFWLMATNLAHGAGLLDELGFRATRMPLYPVLLSLAADLDHGVVMAKATQWCVGALAAPLTALLAAHLVGQRTGILAGFLVAVDPHLVFLSSLLLSETVFITALLMVWLAAASIATKFAAAHWIRWLLLALAAAACVYSKGVAVVLIAPLLAALFVLDRFRARTLAGVAVVAVVILVSLIPWGLRNQRVVGSWSWLTTRSGVSLYDGVGPQATGASDIGDIQKSQAVRGLTETEWNRHFLAESLRSMRADPHRIIRLALVKLRRTWNPLPNVHTYQSTTVRVIALTWSLSIFVLAAAGIMILLTRNGRRWRNALILLLLPALCLSVLHAFFVGSVRYRMPAMPMIEILASIGGMAMAFGRNSVRAIGAGRKNLQQEA